ncbi:hypothetical protein D9615_009512 [Tricholomella constricta]|uniref:WW domain-containing protein n=1 Tax=Tricholomella constricta TaxID=117010 RepID=A0A8H5LXN9_9AGAR|nr:hypothetical protein D9615_009512 [Tricholomella constricta]
MATTNDEQPRPTTTKSDEDIEKSTEETVKDSKDSVPAEQNSSGQDEPEKADAADSGDVTPASTSTPPTPASTPWQAVFAPQYNAYYFYNTETQQTTWENPLLPPATSTSSSSSQPPASASPATEDPTSSAYTSQYAALEAAALAAGIDPSLAHLDPTLLSSIPSSSGVAPASGLPPAFTAKFNARTGQFARPDARDPTHLSEHARAARMSEFYFDVNAWEQQLAAQGGSIKGGEEEEGKKRKRPSKKDLERFREQKKQKKIAKTAWLRT